MSRVPRRAACNTTCISTTRTLPAPCPTRTGNHTSAGSRTRTPGTLGDDVTTTEGAVDACTVHEMPTSSYRFVNDAEAQPRAPAGAELEIGDPSLARRFRHARRGDVRSVHASVARPPGRAVYCATRLVALCSPRTVRTMDRHTEGSGAHADAILHGKLGAKDDDARRRHGFEPCVSCRPVGDSIPFESVARIVTIISTEMPIHWTRRNRSRLERRRPSRDLFMHAPSRSRRCPSIHDLRASLPVSPPRPERKSIDLGNAQ